MSLKPIYVLMKKPFLVVVLLVNALACVTLATEPDLPEDVAPGFLGNVIAGTYFWHEVDENPDLSEQAARLLRKSLKDIPYIVDAHMHLLGVQTQKTGCYMHPDTFDYWNAFQWLKAKAVSAATGIIDNASSDEQAFARNLTLVKKFPYRVPYVGSAFAFSASYDLFSGQIDWARTSMAVPNEYMLKVTGETDPMFIPVGSVHPYDNDAISKLRDLASKGVRLIKWLPNSQHILADHPKSLRFLEELAKLKMVLVTHVGDEHAVSVAGVENQFGNPELYRKALKQIPDLHIIFAHVGSEGTSLVAGEEHTNFDLVISLLKEFPKQVFADVSAFSSAFRRVRYITQLLNETNIHGQLIYGTDYPLAAVGSLVFWTTKYMWLKGLLSYEQTSLIHEIFRHNPLAAAFVIMRTINDNGKTLPPEVFYKNIRKVFHEGHVPLQISAAEGSSR